MPSFWKRLFKSDTRWAWRPVEHKPRRPRSRSQGRPASMPPVQNSSAIQSAKDLSVRAARRASDISPDSPRSIHTTDIRQSQKHYNKKDFGRYDRILIWAYRNANDCTDDEAIQALVEEGSIKPPQPPAKNHHSNRSSKQKGKARAVGVVRPKHGRRDQRHLSSRSLASNDVNSQSSTDRRPRARSVGGMPRRGQSHTSQDRNANSQVHQSVRTQKPPDAFTRYIQPSNDPVRLAARPSSDGRQSAPPVRSSRDSQLRQQSQGTRPSSASLPIQGMNTFAPAQSSNGRSRARSATVPGDQVSTLTNVSRSRTKKTSSRPRVATLPSTGVPASTSDVPPTSQSSPPCWGDATRTYVPCAPSISSSLPSPIASKTPLSVPKRAAQQIPMSQTSSLSPAKPRPRAASAPKPSDAWGNNTRTIVPVLQAPSQSSVDPQARRSFSPQQSLHDWGNGTRTIVPARH